MEIHLETHYGLGVLLITQNLALPPPLIFMTARNEVRARLNFHRHLRFCPQGWEWGSLLPGGGAWSQGVSAPGGGVPAPGGAWSRGGAWFWGVPGPRGCLLPVSVCS